MAELVEDEQVKKLKRLLEGWRMALLPIKSMFLWEKHWHPYALVTSVSFFFFFIWILDLNTLAAMSVVGLILNLIDFLVPIACNTIYSPNTWTGQQEKMFEDICRNIVKQYNTLSSKINSFFALRENSPTLYYANSIGILCILMWMASTVSNICLLYIISTMLVLWPGFEQRGIYESFKSLVFCSSSKIPFLKTD